MLSAVLCDLTQKSHLQILLDKKLYQFYKLSFNAFVIVITLNLVHSDNNRRFLQYINVTVQSVWPEKEWVNPGPA